MTLNVRLALSAAIVFTACWRSGGGTERYALLTRAMVEDHSLFLDHQPFQNNVDVFVHGQHAVLDTGPGTAILAAPAWSLTWAAIGSRGRSVLLANERLHMLAAIWVSWLTVTLPAAIGAVVLLFALARAIGDRLTAGITVLFGVFGSNLLFLGSQLNNNVPIAAVTLYAALVFLRVTRENRRLSVSEFVVLTSGIGLGLFIDLGILPLLVVALPAIWIQRPKVSYLQLAFRSAPAAAAVLALLTYQWTVFGHPFLPPQFYIPASSQPSIPIEHLSLQRAFDLLLGIRESILAFTPLALVGVWQLLKGNSTAHSVPRIWRLGSLAFLIASFLFIWALPLCQCSYGPRYLLSPILIAMSMLSVLPPRRLTTPLLALVAYSVVVNVAGVAQGLQTASLPFSLGLFLEAGFSLPLIDVIKEVSSYFGYSPSHMGSSGIVFASAAFLAAIWLPAALALVETRARQTP